MIKSLTSMNNLYKILPKTGFRSFPLIFQWNTLIIILKTTISNLIKSLTSMNNLYKILPKTGFRSFPLIFQWNTLIIEIRNNYLWDGTLGVNPFFLIGGWTHCFTILFSYWFSITTIKNPIVPNQMQPEVPHQSYFFYWGSFSNRKKGLNE